MYDLHCRRNVVRTTAFCDERVIIFGKGIFPWVTVGLQAPLRCQDLISDLLVCGGILGLKFSLVELRC